MKRPFSFIALAGFCMLAASAAHAQSVKLVGSGVSTSTMNYAAMPEVARDPKGMVAPFNGTAEEAYVKERIRAAGYTGVNSLVIDKEGVWHALAYKGSADVQLAFDRSGHITETTH